MSLAEAFTILRTDAEQPSGARLRARPIGLTLPSGDVYVALDAARSMHLLIPDAAAEQIVDHSSEGVSLSPSYWEIRNKVLLFADLACNVPELSRVFEALAEDVIDELGVGSKSPASTAQDVLAQWRALLRRTSRPNQSSNIIGLLGELYVLGILGRGNPRGALASWCGPSGALHDFREGGRAIEVKSTSTRDGVRVRISGLDQLDPRMCDDLHLAVVHLADDPRADSIDELIEELLQQGFPRMALIEKVAEAGHIYGARQDEKRYAVQSLHMWRVTEDFPGIRRSFVPEQSLRGVQDVGFTLDVSAAPTRMDDADTGHVLESWVK